jgi:signal transduction histidine kinase
MILLAGFGGLLILMAFAALDSMQVLRQIETDNNEIRRDFLYRNRILAEIRSSLYLSGTYVRDYLLDPDIGQAEAHRHSLQHTRAEMDAALNAYSRLLRPEERGPFHGLMRDLAEYWKVLDPVLTWSAGERRAHGYRFLRDEVYPRRASMLRLEAQIAHVNEQQLSAGNRRVSEMFSAFRWRLGLTLAITLGVGLLLAAVSISNALRLEREAQARYLEIERARGELKELSARLVEAQENERRNISRELHDEVGQTLSAVVVELSSLSASIATGSHAELRGHVDTIKRLVEASMGAVRNMALLLRPSMLDDIGLLPALRWQAREVARRSGLRVDVASDDLMAELPDEFKTCIYRVVQEALHNCSRHAEAGVCRVSLREDGQRVLLAIQDDGKGFNLRQERGLGLLGIQERVERLGGALHVESEPGKGTLLAISLPLAPPARGMVAHPLKSANV